MPAGISPMDLLEHFRKNINDFIDPSIYVKFKPYADGVFNDSAKFLSPYSSSMGSLVQIVMLNNGSVVLSDYYNNLTGNQKHHFKFTTIETPLDLEHPVAGNREFGVYEDPNRAGEFVFYIMGVDRTWDISMALLNSTGKGFDAADKLWRSVQDKMISYINSNGGTAEFYSTKEIKARPKWNEAKRFLRSAMPFSTLKSLLDVNK